MASIVVFPELDNNHFVDISKQISERETIIIVRAKMLSELYCAYMLSKHKEYCSYIITDPVTELDEKTLDSIIGKNVIIFGGYYRYNMKPIMSVAESMTVILQDEPTYVTTYPRLRHNKPVDITNKYIVQVETINSTPFMYVSALIKMNELEEIIGTYLNNYSYEIPTDESRAFQQGLYVLDFPTDLDKIKYALNGGFEFITNKGKDKLISNDQIAKIRYADSILIEYDGKIIVVGCGDTPIIDTCMYFAKQSPSGIGMLVRYNYKLNKTFVSICSVNESIHAGKFANQLINGGGTFFMGGGNVKDIVKPQDLFIN
jgi:cell division ATPase FtsA